MKTLQKKLSIIRKIAVDEFGVMRSGSGYSSLLHATRPVYTPPTPTEIGILLDSLGITRTKAARLAGLAGSRQMRAYLAGERKISYPIFYTLIHRSCGVTITREGWREELKKKLT
jgi:hypothetical protein